MASKPNKWLNRFQPSVINTFLHVTQFPNPPTQNPHSRSSACANPKALHKWWFDKLSIIPPNPENYQFLIVNSYCLQSCSISFRELQKSIECMHWLHAVVGGLHHCLLANCKQFSGNVQFAKPPGSLYWRWCLIIESRVKANAKRKLAKLTQPEYDLKNPKL